MTRSSTLLILSALASTAVSAAVPGACGTMTFDLFTDTTTTSGSDSMNWKVGSVANEGTRPDGVSGLPRIFILSRAVFV